MNEIEKSLVGYIEGLKSNVVDDFEAGRYEFYTADNGSANAHLPLRVALAQANRQLAELGGLTGEAAASLLGGIAIVMQLSNAKLEAGLAKAAEEPAPEVIRSLEPKSRISTASLRKRGM